MARPAGGGCRGFGPATRGGAQMADVRAGRRTADSWHSVLVSPRCLARLCLAQLCVSALLRSVRRPPFPSPLRPPWLLRASGAACALCRASGRLFYCVPSVPSDPLWR